MNEKSTSRSQRIIAAALLIGLASALGGCAGGLGSFDPTDLLDFLDTKKKLPGERKPVFPEGVPGLEQGVPKDLYKGAQQDQIQQNAEVAAPAEPPASKQTAKSRTKGKAGATASTTPVQQPSAAPDADAMPDEDSTPAAPPAPKAKKVARKRTTAPPPDQIAAQPAQPAQSAQSAQQQPQQSASPFPAPLPSGSFSR